MISPKVDQFEREYENYFSKKNSSKSSKRFVSVEE